MELKHEMEMRENKVKSREMELEGEENFLRLEKV